MNEYKEAIDKELLKELSIIINQNFDIQFFRFKNIFDNGYTYCCFDFINNIPVIHCFLYRNASWGYWKVNKDTGVKYNTHHFNFDKNPILNTKVFTKISPYQDDYENHLKIIERQLKIESVINN